MPPPPPHTITISSMFNFIHMHACVQLVKTDRAHLQLVMMILQIPVLPKILQSASQRNSLRLVRCRVLSGVEVGGGGGGGGGGGESGAQTL